MMRPDFYPEEPPRVELRQTHMSYAFLADEYVYKVKKALRFEFADCSTLAARYQFCREEIRLNRRLAPETYLGVVSIIRNGRRFQISNEAGTFDPGATEYAVKMRRLPEDRMFDRLVRIGEANAAHIDKIAQILANFHRGASGAAGARYGSPTAVQRLVFSNLEESKRFLSNTITEQQVQAIGHYFNGFLAAHRELLEDRVREGHVREGHGDLRCEHICMTNGIQIFDCLEFSESLRYGDVASDIAFLSMDLDSLGATGLADELVRAYTEETADSSLPLLINLYKCHRACVRGKVESLKSLEQEIPPVERELARKSARDFFSLGFSYAARGRPALVIVCGLSGTGKSTVSRILQYRTGFEVLTSDRVRKRITYTAETFDDKTAYGAGIYSPEIDRLTYDTLLAEAEGRLQRGRGVIIDATFKKPTDRRAALAIGVRTRVPVFFVETRAEHEEVLRRLKGRSRDRRGPSDATEEVYLQQRRDFVPLAEISARQHIVVDTTKGAELAIPIVEEAITYLSR